MILNMPSYFSLLPLLALRRRWPVPALVVLLGNVSPVGRKHGSSAGLEALHHGPPLLLVSLREDLLEKVHARVLPVLRPILHDLSLDLLVNLVPVLLELRAGRIEVLLPGRSFRDADAVSPQEHPIFALLLLLHDDLDAVQPMDGLGPGRHDRPEEDEVQMVFLTLLLDGEVDCDPIFLELHNQVVLLLNHVRDLNAHLGRSLIPRVGELCAKQLGLIHVFPPQFDDAALLQCVAAGLLDPLQEVCAHVGIKCSRIQKMSKAKKQEKKSQAKVEGPQAVAEVFSATRDVEVLHPYHLDGDLEMYSEEKLEAREELKNDMDVVRELTEVTKLYEWTELEGVGKIVGAKEYKHKQRALAVILRPDIDKEELEFIVDSDWQHDRITAQSREYITRQKLIDGLWELVDVWTIGDAKEEYLSFIRLLKKKLERTLKTEK